MYIVRTYLEEYSTKSLKIALMSPLNFKGLAEHVVVLYETSSLSTNDGAEAQQFSRHHCTGVTPAPQPPRATKASP